MISFTMLNIFLILKEFFHQIKSNAYTFLLSTATEKFEETQCLGSGNIGHPCPGAAAPMPKDQCLLWWMP
jgi:hypothetical protein